MAEDSNFHKCVGCGARSPQTETNYTLISSRHGWRLTRTVDAAGNRVLEWYCPACWTKQRQKSGLGNSGGPPGRF